MNPNILFIHQCLDTLIKHGVDLNEYNKRVGEKSKGSLILWAHLTYTPKIAECIVKTHDELISACYTEVKDDELISWASPENLLKYYIDQATKK